MGSCIAFCLQGPRLNLPTLMSPLVTGLGLWVLMVFPAAAAAAGCADTAACQHHCAMSQGCSCNPFPTTARLRKITPVSAIMSSLRQSGYEGTSCINGFVGDICHTENTENFPWIAFQLSQAHPVFVSHVAVINRSTNGSRLRNFEVRVSNTQPLIGDKKFTDGTKIGPTFRGPASDNQIIDFFAPHDVSGKWVVLQMQNRDHLNLAEVIVYGY